ncbi:hypothetical protein MWN41_09440, partial [Ornithobacterium rhinotracheale]
MVKKIFLLLSFTSSLAFGQVKISDIEGEMTVSSSASLELESNDKALLLPRLTYDQIMKMTSDNKEKILEGMLVFCID